MIGATGLVGAMLAPRLVAMGHELLILGRRPSGVAGARERLGPMETWPDLLAGETLDVAISTLGTTWRQAGSWEAFEAVDKRAVAGFAAAARAAGAGQMMAISSVGADAGARNRYLRVKGEAEAALAALGFDRLDLVRPGLLRGERGGPRRHGEAFGIMVSPVLNLLLRGPLDRYAAIDAGLVARAMARWAGAPDGGRFVHHNREIRAAAAIATG